MGVVLGLAVACSVSVDETNKACPCGSGFVCDQARNVCVTPQDLAVATVPTCGDACTCNVDLDCKDPARPRCSPAKKCVECTRTPDTCPAGSYCNELFQCTLGCKKESDCQLSPAVPHCEATRHQCVECVIGGAPCMGGKTCSPSGTCAESCSSPGTPCAKGLCCQGLCVDTAADLLNCGGCGTSCVNTNGTPTCASGACAWTCASGFTHCDSGNTGCETNTRSDPAHCGACGKNCDNLNANGVSCGAGACDYKTCLAGFGDCDGIRTNGCECACGATKGQACCPGNTCTNGLSCNLGSRKCM